MFCKVKHLLQISTKQYLCLFPEMTYMDFTLTLKKLQIYCLHHKTKPPSEYNPHLDRMPNSIRMIWGYGNLWEEQVDLFDRKCYLSLM